MVFDIELLYISWVICIASVYFGIFFIGNIWFTLTSGTFYRFNVMFNIIYDWMQMEYSATITEVD